MAKSLLVVLSLLLYPAVLQAGVVIFPGGGSGIPIDEVISKDPLPPDGNIRSTLLYRAEGGSVHLVQIRDREKPHIHRDHDLIVFLKKGKGRLTLGDKVIEMKEGDVAVIPRGVPHWYENTSEGVSAGIGVFTPPFDGKDTVPVDGEGRQEGG